MTSINTNSLTSNSLASSNLSLELLERISSLRNEPLWLLQKRKKAFDAFLNLDIPQMKYGITILFSLHNLNLESLDFTDDYQPVLFETIHQDQQAVIMDLHSALKHIHYSEIIKKHLFSTLDDNNAEWLKFDSLHCGFFNRGIFVYIPKNAAIKQLINLDFSTLNKTQLDHTLIVAEEGSSAVIVLGAKINKHITNHQQNTKNYQELKTNYVEVFLKNNAQLNIIKTQNYNEHVYHFEQNNTVVEADSKINWHVSTLGSLHTKSDTVVKLKGKGSSSTIHALFLGNNVQRFDLNAAAIHQAEHTRSTIIAKGVVKDRAKALFKGLIDIKEHAKYSEGSQKEDALLLSNSAEADAIPKLLVANNDVKCSHSASIGQVDKERLFYMMSRGLVEQKAKHMIVEGFFSDLLELLPDEELKNQLKEIVHTQIIEGCTEECKEYCDQDC